MFRRKNMIKLKRYVIFQLFAIIFTVAFLTLTLHVLMYDHSEDEENHSGPKSVQWSCYRWQTLVKQIRNCLIHGLKTHSAWYLFETMIQECVGNETLRALNIRVLTNIDDTKLAMFDLEGRTGCTVLTLGVGKNIHGERTLMAAMPHCSFFGVDPINESGVVYKRIGKYYEWGIGNDTWYKDVVLRINGVKYKAEIAFLNFFYFVHEILNRTIIDILFMDAAGVEYDILPLFYKRNSGKNNVTVCQMTVELHGPPGSYGLTKQSYDTFVYRLVRYTPFVPLWSREHEKHTKVYLFNAESRYCVEKYLPQMCRESDAIVTD